MRLYLQLNHFISNKSIHLSRLLDYKLKNYYSIPVEASGEASVHSGKRRLIEQISLLSKRILTILPGIAFYFLPRKIKATILIMSSLYTISIYNHPCRNAEYYELFKLSIRSIEFFFMYRYSRSIQSTCKKICIPLSLLESAKVLIDIKMDHTAFVYYSRYWYPQLEEIQQSSSQNFIQKINIAFRFIFPRD